MRMMIRMTGDAAGGLTGVLDSLIVGLVILLCIGVSLRILTKSVSGKGAGCAKSCGSGACGSRKASMVLKK